MLAAVILIGGFFVVSYVLAVATVTPASGGSGQFVELSGPSIAESSPGDITVGAHTLTLPAGWEFDTSSTITVVRTAGNILPFSQVAALTANTLTFTINNPSSTISSLAFIMIIF